MQFGKLFAVFQQHPADPNKTVVSVFMTLAVESNILVKRQEYAQVPVLQESGAGPSPCRQEQLQLRASR